MSVPRTLLAALLVITATLLQTTVVARLFLPFGRPDLVLVVVVGVALVAGPGPGTTVGFAGGLLCDLLADHPIGMLALVMCVVGYGCGLVRATPGRGVVVPLLVVAGAAVAATLSDALLLAMAGNPRLDWRVAGGHLPGSVAYDVALAVVVLPVVAALHGRLDSDEG